MTDFDKTFQYFSVIVPTAYTGEQLSSPTAPAPPIAGPTSDNSYLRFGDTPTQEDMAGQDEPGLALRSLLEGTPAWSSTLYKDFAPNGTDLRVNAGHAIAYGAALDSDFYKNVGWVDHSNGHRVTTTHGDKVEVITGNYKLVVMGREGSPEGSTGFDMSGGHTVNWAKTPGCVRTITAEGDSFKVTHVTDKGHEHTVFHGFDTDHVVGGSTSISVMGGSSDLTQHQVYEAMALVVDQAWSQKIVDGDYGDIIVDIDAGEPMSNWDFTESNDLKANAAALSQYPDNFGEVKAYSAASRVIEARRAKQYDEWVAVDGTFTEEVHAGTFDFTLDCGAGNFSEEITAGQMDNTVTVAGTVTEDWTAVQYNEYFKGNRFNRTVASWETEQHFAGMKTDLVVAGAWTEWFGGAVKTTVEGHLINSNVSLAVLHTDNKIGFVWESNKFKVEVTPMEIKQGVIDICQIGGAVLGFNTLDLGFNDLNIRF